MALTGLPIAFADIPKRQSRSVLFVSCAYVLISVAALGEAPPANTGSTNSPAPKSDVQSTANKDERVRFFETNIRPVLVEHCYSCHGEDEASRGGDFRLDTPSALLAGGSRGPAMVKGAPQTSLLVRAMNYEIPDLQMPPDGKLPQEKIDAVKKWVQEGAEDPRKDEPVSHAPKSTFADRQSLAKDHWAYKQVQPPPTAVQAIGSEPPALALEVDKLIGKKLVKNKLKFSPVADRRTLVRRLYIDLLGLPPTFEELEEALADKNEDWYATLVNKLLESPHFGERMARRWMDVARYADNKGYVFKEDREYPHAFRYRDWLIRSFNSDLSYDQFLKYQIIADQLDPDNSKGHLDAMGMLTLGRRFLQNKNDIADDRIDVITRGFLGTTVACARCHDHKFDPVSSADYYSLRGAFVGSDEPGGEPSPMRLVDKEKQAEVFVFLRGNEGNRGPVVEKKFFSGVLGERSRKMSTGSGRFDIANSMVAECKDLTARVYVNRIWNWITGNPIVDTPSDFGLRCEAPVQHDVLELLSTDFIESGWSTKRLIRTILLTRTYMQKSSHQPDAYTVDPDNRLFWRAKRRRMDFETFRDALLVATGAIDRSIGGPSVKIHEPPFSNRRTLYAYIDRQNLPSLFRTFDFASPDAHVPQRSETTVPQQGLVLMNSDIMMNLLDDFSKRTPKKSDSSDEAPQDAIGDLFKKILARKPSAAERQAIKDFCSVAIVDLPKTPEFCWQYGYGGISADLKKIKSFKPLPAFVESKWMGLDGKLPDKKLGYLSLTAKGGHPGDGLGRCVIRRWIAPISGKIQVSGKLEHSADKGDGIRGIVIANSDRVLGNWEVRHGNSATDIEAFHVKEGDSVDFLVSAQKDTNSDSFLWTCQLKYEKEGSVFSSEKHFGGMKPIALDRLQQTAQSLLLSNEFCFVD